MGEDEDEEAHLLVALEAGEGLVLAGAGLVLAGAVLVLAGPADEICIKYSKAKEMIFSTHMAKAVVLRTFSFSTL